MYIGVSEDLVTRLLLFERRFVKEDLDVDFLNVEFCGRDGCPLAGCHDGQSGNPFQIVESEVVTHCVRVWGFPLEGHRFE